MNTVKKKLISSTGEIVVINKELIKRFDVLMKKENKRLLVKWIILDFVTYKTTDIWYVVDTKTNEREEVKSSKLIEFYDLLRPGEIMQNEYYKKKEDQTPVFKSLNLL